MSEFVERRLSPRYPAVINQVIIGLSMRHSVGASLVNISRTGALLSIREKPQLHSSIRIRLKYPLRSPWVEARVVRIRDEGGIGIAFVHGCDRTLFYGSLEGNDFRMATYQECVEPAEPL
jgi:hypothetical protein